MWIVPSRSAILPCGFSWDFLRWRLIMATPSTTGAVLGGADLEDLARLALVGAGDDNDLVVAFDVKFLGHVREPPERAR